MMLEEALATGRPEPKNVGVHTRPPGPLVRVYAKTRAPDAFNGTSRGNARFSPLVTSVGVVPTIYAASTVAAALMEVVLRDVPTPSAGHPVGINEATEMRRIAQVQTTVALQLADLSAIGLRRLGLERADVVERGVDHYPVTRKLGVWIYENCPNVQGLQWTSRQDDTAQAVVLFGPRLPAGAVQVVSHDEPFTESPHLEVLMDVVERLGASLFIAPAP